jgi:hypothetical protein
VAEVSSSRERSSSGVGALLLYPVPVWSVLAVLLAAALLCAIPAVGRDDPVTGVLMTVALVAALGLGLYDEQLTVAATAVALVVAALLHLRTTRETSAVASGAAAPVLVAALTWGIGGVADASATWTALAGVLLLSGVALVRVHLPAGTAAPRARLVVEVAAAVSAALLAVTGVDGAPVGRESGWAAIYLTIGGAAATAMALLREDRRRVGWLGAGLLVTASWVRLADLGVHAPEPYTLPAAVVLLALGLLRLRRDRHCSTLRALGPGLGLALVPSLLWVLDEPGTARAAVLGLACLALVVAGLRLRWTAPLVAGALAGGLLVLREAAPYVGAAVPRWALIGAAGVLLIALGVTWEQRLRDARKWADQLRALR